jgi:putative flavoprotein involved in K+ transport
MTVYDAIVVGAGQAGLAAGYHLKRAHLNFEILEASGQPAGSWPSYYDNLKLFSPAAYSSLPGMRFPGKGNRYPTRDEVIDYLISYTEHFQLPVITNTRVEQIERTGDAFRVTTSAGNIYRTRSIIAATGSFSRPHTPQLPGQEVFAGEILHSSAYRRPERFAGKRVIVVGAGNSAVQIAVELARVAQVTLATRQPINFVPQVILGKDIHFWEWITGIDTRTLKNKTRTIHVLDTGIYRRAIKSNQPDQRPMFTGLTDSGVVWPGGQTEPIDTIILATGYRPNLAFLRGLGALDEGGDALHTFGISDSVPGLYYVGLSNQRSNASATLRGVGRDAQYVIRSLSQHLKQPAGSSIRCCAVPEAS